MRKLRGDSAIQSSLGSDGNDRHQTPSPAGYLLDSDERATQLAALATVALFDVPGIDTRRRRVSAANRQQKDPPPVRAGIRATLEKILEKEEPQWAPDDCPIIRRLSLYNQCLLNKSLFAKARGAQPLRSPRASSATAANRIEAGTPQTKTEGVEVPFSEECLNVELWRLAEWLARTRRCLSARLFLDKAEASGLELAMTSHVEWLEDSAQCNYMQINISGQPEKTAGADAVAATLQAKPQTLQDKGGKKRGVHPFNVWFEPRAPRPDDRRVQQTIGRFDVAVKAHEFYPVKFPHTKARRGGKPRMMRGRSGRWFWLGPYWKPPWAPKRKSFTEDWHLTNATA
ncbi:uncharacterized protein EMH_0026120 [Eimeria mitis]|uniref:Uncharacterized protein n=1 Tax=Eimeria mitis TaxID=44415 RepID=U6KGS6_9EIME|nr:uncharacterized protein EMH_0026120 [Eimeria mitis]CDJ35447.1 hypothetical protein, conserved [Eimeria mitis]